MKIANGTVVSIDYRLHLGDGKIIDASEPGDPLTYLHGEGQIVPGLERELDGARRRRRAQGGGRARPTATATGTRPASSRSSGRPSRPTSS